MRHVLPTHPYLTLSNEIDSNNRPNVIRLYAQKSILALLILMCSTIVFAQTQVKMSLANATQTADNQFEFDVFLENTGNTELAMVNYSFGVDHAPGLSNGGALTYSYIQGSRDIALSSITGISTTYSANTQQFRFTTSSSSITTNPVLLQAGIPMKLARMRVTNTVAFPFCFQPNLSLHTIAGGGYTQCVASCFILPNNLAVFSIVGAGNILSGTNVLGLIAENLPPVFVLTTCPMPIVTNSVFASCDSYTWPVNGQTYTASGQFTQNIPTTCNCFNTQILNLTINHTTSSTQVVTATGNTYTWAANGSTYTASGIYTATVTSAFACDSIVTLDLTIGPNQTTLELHCFIAGYWAGNNSMTAVLENQSVTALPTSCDSIDVELRSAIAPHQIIASTRTVLTKNGTALCTFSPVSGTYYIAVKHRNALETWSALPIQLGSAVASYDFTTASNKAYGNNMSEVAPGVWAFFSGDINRDENIDLLDLQIVETGIYNYWYGYYSSDLTGDGNVDLLDTPDLETNLYGFSYSQHP